MAQVSMIKPKMGLFLRLAVSVGILLATPIIMVLFALLGAYISMVCIGRTVADILANDRDY